MMKFGLPKGSYKLAGGPRNSLVDKGKWCRIVDATNLPQRGYFASRLDSRDSIHLTLEDFSAIIGVDEDGMVTYSCELTGHSPGDWCSFHLFSEIGQPYQHLFAEFAENCVVVNIDYYPYTADFYVPDGLIKHVPFKENSNA